MVKNRELKPTITSSLSAPMTLPFPSSILNPCYRYGLTVFGLSDVITTVFLNGISYFGTISELNRALMTHLSQASDTITNEHISAFEGVNRVLEYYPFREGVERKIVLVANEV